MDRIHHLLHTDITSKFHIWLHLFIKWLGASFVAVFIPAILYTTFDFTLAQIFLFIAAHSLCSLICLYAMASPLIARQGTKPSMILWVICFSIYLMLLWFGKNIPEFILIAPIFSWLHTGFFRWAYHVSMALQWQSDQQIGKHVAMISIAAMSAAMIGPVLWGLITDHLGTLFLFVSSGILWLLSLIPLWLDDHAHTEISWRPSLHPRKLRKIKRDILLSFSGLGYMQFVGSTVRSILLFIHFQSFTKLGIISFATWFLVMWAMWIIGKVSDQDDKKSQKRLQYTIRSQSSNRLIMGILLVLSFFSNVVFIVADSVHKLTHKISSTYLNKNLYVRTISNNVSDALENTIYHELGIHIFRICICLILAGISTYIPSEKALLMIPIFLVVLIAPLQLLVMSKKEINKI